MCRIKYLIIIFFAWALVSCGNEDAPLPEPEKVVPEFNCGEIQAVEALSDFGIKFFQAACASSDEENIVVSPASALFTLSLLSNGVDDASLKQIQDAMGFSNLNDINSSIKKLLEWYPICVNGVNFERSQSLWYDQSKTIDSNFSDIIKTYYSANLFARDFDNSATMGELKEWIGFETAEWISQLLNETNKKSKLLLFDNISFSGEWMSMFDISKTADGIFHGFNGDKNVEMMNCCNRMGYEYLGPVDSEILLIPFGDEYVFQLTVLIPGKSWTMDDFVSKVYDNRSILAFDYLNTNLTLSFPKISIDTKKHINLLEIFKSMGIKDLGNQQTGKVFTNDDAILEAFQKMALSFGENSVEASSSKVDDIKLLDNPLKIADLTVDRPFIFFILPYDYPIPLIAGKVTNL